MNLFNLLNEGVAKGKLSVKSIADNIRYNLDKFMPDDEEMQNQWYDGTLQDRIDMLESEVDNFFEQYYDSPKEMQFISNHRREILKAAAEL
jgi:hypothetical protein